MLDGDDAGRVASEKIVDRLQRAIFQVDLVTLGDGIQPDQLSDDEINQLLHSLQAK
jgi:DNA primase